MATSTISDIATEFKSLVTEAVAGGFAGVPVMQNIGAVDMRFDLEARLGATVNIPMFSCIGDFEDVSTDGTGLTAASVTVTAATATVFQSGKLVEITDFADKTCPSVEEVKNQILKGYQRRINKACITAACATDAGMTLDCYNASTPAYLNYDQLCDGLALFGDEVEDVCGIVVHPDVLAQLRKTKDDVKRPIFTDAVNGGLGTVLGIPVYVSSTLTPAGNKYTSLILKRNSIGLWVSGNPTIEVDRNIEKATNKLAVHIFAACAKYPRMGGLSKSGVVILQHN